MAKQDGWIPPLSVGHPMQYEFCIERGVPKTKASRWTFGTSCSLYVKRRGYKMLLHEKSSMGTGPHEISSVMPRGVSPTEWIRRQSAQSPA